MKTIKAVITGGKDEFGVWLEEVEGIYGSGETLEDAKQSLLEAIGLFIEETEDLQEELKGEYEIEYSFDIAGFLKYYSKFISFAALKEITGIHQKQLWSYANGYRKPSKETTQKIFEKVKSFSENLSQVQFRF